MRRRAILSYCTAGVGALVLALFVGWWRVDGPGAPEPEGPLPLPLSAMSFRLTDHEGNEIKVEGPDSVVAQDGEFFNAIRENRKALASCSEVFPVMQLIDRVQKTMDGRDGAPSLGMVEEH